ncbi:MAG TPA: glycosyltransferase [Vicinamibacteria bacterium]|nr:glycosyltransferase [Vicinamibacteria bacterium]
MPLVSVIVPVFEQTEPLKRCLAALAIQDYPGDYEILVVDNGEVESLAPVVAGVARARLVHEPQPGSYSARNRGVLEARAEILAFTDADCVPARDWLAAGVRALLAEPECGLVAGRIDLAIADAWQPTAAELYESVAAFRQREYVERWHFGATANLFTRRAVFNRVGLFDERLRSLGDREWGYRVSQAGFFLRYAEGARTCHSARRSVAELLRRTQRLAGGYFELARTGGLTAKTLVLDAPMGLAMRGTLAGLAKDAGARRRPRGAGEHTRVALVTVAVVLIRALELTRLALGGEPRRR